MQKCRCCGEEKNLQDFYKSPCHKTGIATLCKRCSKAKSAIYKALSRRARGAKQRGVKPVTSSSYLASESRREQERKRYHQKHPHRVASELVRNAVKSGKLKKPKSCQKCGATGIIHGHHTDYDKPLEVVWLCNTCHNIEHGKLKGKQQLAA